MTRTNVLLSRPEALHAESASVHSAGELLVTLSPDTTAIIDARATAAQDHASTPSFTRSVGRPRAKHIPVWQWSVLALLVAALCLQILSADRARLAQDGEWRPVLERGCALLHCSLPAWHQPQAYTMLARDVRPVAEVPGVLQLHATFRNDARWAQQWPAIAVSLSDADGRVAGARVLMPKDYLDASLRQTVLAPGQSGEMTMQVREPPGGVVAFAFEFR